MAFNSYWKKIVPSERNLIRTNSRQNANECAFRSKFACVLTGLRRVYTRVYARSASAALENALYGSESVLITYGIRVRHTHRQGVVALLDLGDRFGSLGPNTGRWYYPGKFLKF